MTPAVQAKMLRLLQEQRFERLGGNEQVQTQVRILAATNQDLEKLVTEGRFRKDLYFRLKVVTIRVPPLRDRLEDVAELAHHFLFAYNRELGRDLRGFAPEMLRLLQQYSWPGNVRELQGVIKQAMLNATGHLLLPEFLPEALQPQPLAAGVSRSDVESLDLKALIEDLLRRGETDLHAKVIRQVERVLLTQVLRQTHGHQAQASELLGLNRTTLRYKLRDLNLSLDKIVTGEQSPPSTEEESS
jgi:two-component system nitrogen regulation response regulator GlnG